MPGCRSVAGGDRMTPAEELTTAAARLEALVAGATPGPWRFEPEGDYECGEPGCCCEYWDNRIWGGTDLPVAESHQMSEADARLIVLLRNLAPNLPELLRAEGERMGGLITIDYEGNPMHTPNPHLLAIAREVNETGESK